MTDDASAPDATQERALPAEVVYAVAAAVNLDPRHLAAALDRFRGAYSSPRACIAALFVDAVVPELAWLFDHLDHDAAWHQLRRACIAVEHRGLWYIFDLPARP